jgi:hypothetical protein
VRNPRQHRGANAELARDLDILLEPLPRQGEIGVGSGVEVAGYPLEVALNRFVGDGGDDLIDGRDARVPDRAGLRLVPVSCELVQAPITATSTSRSSSSRGNRVRLMESVQNDVGSIEGLGLFAAMSIATGR